MTYFNKNCFDILPTIPDKSVDLIFCDLPYNSTICMWDCAIDLNKLWIEFKRIRKDTTPIIMTCTTKFGYKLIQSNEKEFKYDLVWQKSKKVGFLQARKRPLCNHEMVYFFYKKLPKYNYLKYHKYSKKESNKISESHLNNNTCYGKNKQPRHERNTSYEPQLPASVICGDDNSIYGEVKRDKRKYNKEKGELENLYNPQLPASILKIKSTKPSKHQTGKPLDLMEFILKYWTDEQDTVFDPTFGGGSMPIQCKKMNRKFIGCEMDKKIYDDAIELLSKV